MRQWGPPGGACTGSPPTDRRSPVTWTMKRLTRETWTKMVRISDLRRERLGRGSWERPPRRRRLGRGLGVLRPGVGRRVLQVVGHADARVRPGLRVLDFWPLSQCVTFDGVKVTSTSQHQSGQHL
eukprot:6594293-Prymnesium_polylepis.2